MSGLNGEALRTCDACGLTVDLLVSKTISCETCQTDAVRCDDCVKLHAPGTAYRCSFCTRVQHRVEDSLIEDMEYSPPDDVPMDDLLDADSELDEEPTDADLDAIEADPEVLPDDEELRRVEDLNEEGE